MIKFDSKNEFNKKPFGAVPFGEQLIFKAEVSEPCNKAFLCVRLDRTGFGEDERFEIEGSRVSGCDDTDFALFEFAWTPEKTGLYFYSFKAAHGIGESDNASASCDGISVGNEEVSGAYQLTVYDYMVMPPKWMSEGIMYQIFPDRFARKGMCDPEVGRIDGRKRVMHENWNELPKIGPDENGIVKNDDFFGGNLAGITTKLPYLAELGVTVIYLNPIFTAYSNHRYDTGNYMEIDPLLGTEEDFRNLCSSAKAYGMRVIFDGVFNHTGSDSVYFNKYGTYGSGGAYNNENSPYKSWYGFIDYPDKYDSWWGIDTLPSVNETSESYRDFIARADYSVLRHWLRAGASGVRLDVADELPDEILDDIYACVKEEKEDAVVIGEVWEDASNKIAYSKRRRYFQGKQLDSVMNYPLKDAIISYIGYTRNGEDFGRVMDTLCENYPHSNFNSMMNILGTHDTERILTVFENCSSSYDEARQKLFVSLLIWAFMPGIPCIYYGDEIGMRGGKDPDNRRTFDYEKRNGEIERFYRRVLGLRAKIANISDMKFRTIEADGGYYCFVRENKEYSIAPNTDKSNGSVLVAVNMSDTVREINVFHDTNDMNSELRHSAINLKTSEELQTKSNDVKIIDFVISGSVEMIEMGKFRIAPQSGIAVYMMK